MPLRVVQLLQGAPHPPQTPLTPRRLAYAPALRRESSFVNQAIHVFGHSATRRRCRGPPRVFLAPCRPIRNRLIFAGGIGGLLRLRPQMVQSKLGANGASHLATCSSNLSYPHPPEAYLRKHCTLKRKAKRSSFKALQENRER